MGLIFRPNIFKPFPQVVAAMTYRGGVREPYGFNMSSYIGDAEERVTANRRKLAEGLGFPLDRLAVQRQVHGDRAVRVGEDYRPGESDALHTDEAGRLLAVSIADCVPVLVAEPEWGVVAAIHSGWRGSAQNIAGKTVKRLKREYGLSAAGLYLWIGPSAGQCCYEVGGDVAEAFAARHSREIGGGKYLFDNRGVVLEQLIDAGADPEHIEVDIRCTICDRRFHSWRREREQSGRMFAVIGLRDEHNDG